MSSKAKASKLVSPREKQNVTSRKSSKVKPNKCSSPAKAANSQRNLKNKCITDKVFASDEVIENIKLPALKNFKNRKKGCAGSFKVDTSESSGSISSKTICTDDTINQVFSTDSNVICNETVKSDLVIKHNLDQSSSLPVSLSRHLLSNANVGITKSCSGRYSFRQQQKVNSSVPNKSPTADLKLRSDHTSTSQRKILDNNLSPCSSSEHSSFTEHLPPNSVSTSKRKKKTSLSCGSLESVKSSSIIASKNSCDVSATYRSPSSISESNIVSGDLTSSSESASRKRRKKTASNVNSVRLKTSSNSNVSYSKNSSISAAVIQGKVSENEHSSYSFSENVEISTNLTSSTSKCTPKRGRRKKKECNLEDAKLQATGNSDSCSVVSEVPEKVVDDLSPYLVPKNSSRSNNVSSTSAKLMSNLESRVLETTENSNIPESSKISSDNVSVSHENITNEYPHSLLSESNHLESLPSCSSLTLKKRKVTSNLKCTRPSASAKSTKHVLSPDNTKNRSPYTADMSMPMSSRQIELPSGMINQEIHDTPVSDVLLSEDDASFKSLTSCLTDTESENCENSNRNDAFISLNKNSQTGEAHTPNQNLYLKQGKTSDNIVPLNDLMLTECLKMAGSLDSFNFSDLEMENESMCSTVNSPVQHEQRNEAVLHSNEASSENFREKPQFPQQNIIDKVKKAKQDFLSNIFSAFQCAPHCNDGPDLKSILEAQVIEIAQFVASMNSASNSNNQGTPSDSSNVIITVNPTDIISTEPVNNSNILCSEANSNSSVIPSEMVDLRSEEKDVDGTSFQAQSRTSSPLDLLISDVKGSVDMSNDCVNEGKLKAEKKGGTKRKVRKCIWSSRKRRKRARRVISSESSDKEALDATFSIEELIEKHETNTLDIPNDINDVSIMNLHSEVLKSRLSNILEDETVVSSETIHNAVTEPFIMDKSASTFISPTLEDAAVSGIVESELSGVLESQLSSVLEDEAVVCSETIHNAVTEPFIMDKLASTFISPTLEGAAIGGIVESQLSNFADSPSILQSNSTEMPSIETTQNSASEIIGTENQCPHPFKLTLSNENDGNHLEVIKTKSINAICDQLISESVLAGSPEDQAESCFSEADPNAKCMSPPNSAKVIQDLENQALLCGPNTSLKPVVMIERLSDNVLKLYLDQLNAKSSSQQSPVNEHISCGDLKRNKKFKSYKLCKNVHNSVNEASPILSKSIELSCENNNTATKFSSCKELTTGKSNKLLPAEETLVSRSNVNRTISDVVGSNTAEDCPYSVNSSSSNEFETQEIAQIFTSIKTISNLKNSTNEIKSKLFPTKLSLSNVSSDSNITPTTTDKMTDRKNKFLRIKLKSKACPNKNKEKKQKLRKSKMVPSTCISNHSCNNEIIGNSIFRTPEHHLGDNYKCDKISLECESSPCISEMINDDKISVFESNTIVESLKVNLETENEQCLLKGEINESENNTNCKQNKTKSKTDSKQEKTENCTNSKQDKLKNNTINKKTLKTKDKKEVKKVNSVNTPNNRLRECPTLFEKLNDAIVSKMKSSKEIHKETSVKKKLKSKAITKCPSDSKSMSSDCIQISTNSKKKFTCSDLASFKNKEIPEDSLSCKVITGKSGNKNISESSHIASQIIADSLQNLDKAKINSNKASKVDNTFKANNSILNKNKSAKNCVSKIIGQDESSLKACKTSVKSNKKALRKHNSLRLDEISVSDPVTDNNSLKRKEVVINNSSHGEVESSSKNNSENTHLESDNNDVGDENVCKLLKDKAVEILENSFVETILGSEKTQVISEVNAIENISKTIIIENKIVSKDTKTKILDLKHNKKIVNFETNEFFSKKSVLKTQSSSTAEKSTVDTIPKTKENKTIYDEAISKIDKDMIGEDNVPNIENIIDDNIQNIENIIDDNIQNIENIIDDNIQKIENIIDEGKISNIKNITDEGKFSNIGNVLDDGKVSNIENIEEKMSNIENIEEKMSNIDKMSVPKSISELEKTVNSWENVSDSEYFTVDYNDTHVMDMCTMSDMVHKELVELVDQRPEDISEGNVTESIVHQIVSESNNIVSDSRKKEAPGFNILSAILGGFSEALDYGASDDNDDAFDKNDDASDKNDDTSDKNDDGSNKNDDASNKNDDASNKNDDTSGDKDDAGSESYQSPISLSSVEGENLKIEASIGSGYWKTISPRRSDTLTSNMLDTESLSLDSNCVSTFQSVTCESSPTYQLIQDNSAKRNISGNKKLNSSQLDSDSDEDTEHSFKRYAYVQQDSEKNSDFEFIHETDTVTLDLNKTKKNCFVESGKEFCLAQENASDISKVKFPVNHNLQSDENFSKGYLDIKSSENKSEILLAIQTHCNEGILNKAFQITEESIQYQSCDVINKIILVLTTASVRCINETNQEFLSRILTLIVEYHLYDNPTICSTFITICNSKSKLTLLFVLEMFKLCVSYKTCLNAPAIEALFNIFSSEGVELSLLIELLEYVHLHCKQNISFEFLNFVIDSCTFYGKPQHIKRVSNLLLMMDLKVINGDVLKTFISKLSFSNCLPNPLKVLKSFEAEHLNSTPHASLAQNDTTILSEIQPYINCNQWNKLTELFKKYEAVNDRLGIHSIYNALRIPLEKSAENYTKFMDAAISTEVSVHQRNWLGLIGICLMLEAHSLENMRIAYDILYCLHQNDVNYYELLSASSDIEKSLKFLVLPYTVALAAIDICFEVGKFSSAFNIFTDLEWLRPCNNLSTEMKSLFVSRAKYLLKLTQELHNSNSIVKGLQVLEVLLDSVRKDLLLEDTKEFIKDLSNIYNSYIVLLLNGNELNKAIGLYKWSKIQKFRGFLVVYPFVSRGIVVSCANAGLIDEAQRFFLEFVKEKIYCIPTPGSSHLQLEINWTRCEIHLVVNHFLNILFEERHKVSPKEDFEKGLSLSISIIESSANNRSLLCLRESHESFRLARKNVIHVLTFEMTPPLQVENNVDPLSKLIKICPKSLYERFCVWEKEKSSNLILSNDHPKASSESETLSYPGLDSSFSLDVFSDQGNFSYQENTNYNAISRVKSQSSLQLLENKFVCRKLLPENPDYLLPSSSTASLAAISPSSSLGRNKFGTPTSTPNVGCDYGSENILDEVSLEEKNTNNYASESRSPTIANYKIGRSSRNEDDINYFPNTVSCKTPENMSSSFPNQCARNSDHHSPAMLSSNVLSTFSCHSQNSDSGRIRKASHTPPLPQTFSPNTSQVSATVPDSATHTFSQHSSNSSHDHSPGSTCTQSSGSKYSPKASYNHTPSKKCIHSPSSRCTQSPSNRCTQSPANEYSHSPDRVSSASKLRHGQTTSAKFGSTAVTTILTDTVTSRILNSDTQPITLRRASPTNLNVPNCSPTNIPKVNSILCKPSSKDTGSCSGSQLVTATKDSVKRAIVFDSTKKYSISISRDVEQSKSCSLGHLASGGEKCSQPVIAASPDVRMKLSNKYCGVTLPQASISQSEPNKLVADSSANCQSLFSGISPLNYGQMKRCETTVTSSILCQNEISEPVATKPRLCGLSPLTISEMQKFDAKYNYVNDAHKDQLLIISRDATRPCEETPQNSPQKMERTEALQNRSLSNITSNSGIVHFSTTRMNSDSVQENLSQSTVPSSNKSDSNGLGSTAEATDVFRVPDPSIRKIRRLKREIFRPVTSAANLPNKIIEVPQTLSNKVVNVPQVTPKNLPPKNLPLKILKETPKKVIRFPHRTPVKTTIKFPQRTPVKTAIKVLQKAALKASKNETEAAASAMGSAPDTGSHGCTKDIFNKIQHFLKIKILNKYNNLKSAELDAKATGLANDFLSKNTSTKLDSKTMKTLMIYANAYV